MRIALLLAAGAVVGVAGWAATLPEHASVAAVDASIDEASGPDDVALAPGGLSRPDVLAAPPPRYRRVESGEAMAVVAVLAPIGPDSGVTPPDSVCLTEEGIFGCEGAEIAPSVDPSASGSQGRGSYASSVAGVEHRGYDAARCTEFNFEDRADGQFYVGAAEEPSLYGLESLRKFRAAGSPAASLAIDHLPKWAPSGTVAFEATSESLDAWESALDAATFAGGRDVTLDVVRLGDPATCLADFGLLPPASGTSLAIPLATAEAVVRRARGPSSVTLDVPEDRAVFGFAGQTCTYVADYDIEISQAAYPAEPIYRAAEAGLSVSARVSGGTDRGLEVMLDARWSLSLPEFTTFSTSLASGPVSASQPVVIEIPKTDESASMFRGHFPMQEGEGALVGLSHGAVIVVVPRGAVRDTTHVRTWKSVNLVERPVAEPARPPESETIEVEWTRIDATPTSATRGSARFEHVGESGVLRSSAGPDAQDAALRSLSASGSAFVVPGPVLDRRRIDVVVQTSRPLDPGTRSSQVGTQVGEKWVTSTVELPRVSRVVIPLRFLLRDGETALRDVTIDRGEGPEAWRIAASRRVERAP